MGKTHHEKLRKNHRWLTGTIRTHHITGSLKEKGVLTDDDLTKIKHEDTNEKRTERLLFILAKRSSSAIEAFIQSLKEVREQGTCPYEDIVQLLDQGTDEDKWTQVQKIKGDIAKRLDPKKACDDLTKSHILTEEESDIIQEEKTPFDRAKSLLCILSTKGQSAFLALCRVLHDQGLEDIVSFLNQASVGDTLKPVTNVPERVEHFLETNDATKVEQGLGNSNNPSNIVVFGIPKSGKTQIARWIAKQFRHHHPTAVVWVLDGQNSQTLLASKRKLLEALNAQVTDEEDVTKVDECLDRALQNRGTPVLLIVDDLEDGTLLTPTLLRERIQSRVLILTCQEELQLPAEADVLHISVSGFSTEEAAMFYEENKPKKEEYQVEHAFLEALNKAFNHVPLTWDSALQFMKISHTSPENFVAQLQEGNAVMDIQKEMMRWMLPHYEKFDPAEESKQLRSAMSKLSSTCWEPTSKKSSDGFHSYGYELPASSVKEKSLEKKEESKVSNPSSHIQSNPKVDVDTLHAQAPNDQPVSRGDSTIPKLGNSKDRHEEEKHETTLAECEDNDKTSDGTAQEINIRPQLDYRKDRHEVVAAEQPVEERDKTTLAECEDDKDKTSDGTAQEINITPSTGPTSAQCQEVPPCRQMSQEEPTSTSNIPIPVLERALVPPDIDGIQTTHVATQSTAHGNTTIQERVAGSLENPPQETSAESEHGKVSENAAALPVQKPRRCSYGASTEDQGFGSSHIMTANAPAQSSLATASQVKQCSGKHEPTSEMDSTSSEEVPPTTPPSERDAPDPNIMAQQQDMAAENIDDSTQLKGPLPTACIEGGIEAEGAVGGRCSPYPSQSASQDQTTPSCYSSGRSSIPCPEVQNVSRALSIGSGWDLVRRRHTEIANRMDLELARMYLRNKNVLTEDECRGIVEEEEEDRATSLLCILPAKGQEALLAFCAALRDQSLNDIAALITGSQVSDILRPITNVPDPVNNFFPTHDANIVRRAVRDQHIILVCEVAGSGKTQIARWIAKQFCHHHPTAVVWALDGQNRQTLLASKRKLLEALNAEVTDEEDITKVDECLDRALQNRGTPVLLIVDDLEDGTLLTPTLLRERIQSRVLILTRQAELQLPDETPWPCNLEGGFQTWEGVRFFQMVLEEPDYQVDHLQCTADAFDGHPLGLAAAREFMHNTHTSPEHYLFLLKEEQTAWILQEEAQRFMAQHYKFDQRNLHPVFQAAQDKLRGPRDSPKMDEDTKETCLESPSEYTDNGTSSVQDEQDEPPEGQEEEEEEERMRDKGQGEMPTLGSQTQSEEAATALRLEEDAVTSHVQSPDDQDMESLSSDRCSPAASVRSTEGGLELEGAVDGIFPPPQSHTASEEEQKMREETQSVSSAPSENSKTDGEGWQVVQERCSMKARLSSKSVEVPVGQMEDVNRFSVLIDSSEDLSAVDDDAVSDIEDPWRKELEVDERIIGNEDTKHVNGQEESLPVSSEEQSSSLIKGALSPTGGVVDASVQTEGDTQVEIKTGHPPAEEKEAVSPEDTTEVVTAEQITKKEEEVVSLSKEVKMSYAEVLKSGHASCSSAKLQTKGSHLKKKIISSPKVKKVKKRKEQPKMSPPPSEKPFDGERWQVVQERRSNKAKSPARSKTVQMGKKLNIKDYNRFSVLIDSSEDLPPMDDDAVSDTKEPGRKELVGSSSLSLSPIPTAPSAPQEKCNEEVTKERCKLAKTNMLSRKTDPVAMNKTQQNRKNVSARKDDNTVSDPGSDLGQLKKTAGADQAVRPKIRERKSEREAKKGAVTVSAAWQHRGCLNNERASHRRQNIRCPDYGTIRIVHNLLPSTSSSSSECNLRSLNQDGLYNNMRGRSDHREEFWHYDVTKPGDLKYVQTGQVYAVPFTSLGEQHPIIQGPAGISEYWLPDWLVGACGAECIDERNLKLGTTETVAGIKPKDGVDQECRFDNLEDCRLQSPQESLCQGTNGCMVPQPKPPKSPKPDPSYVHVKVLNTAGQILLEARIFGSAYVEDVALHVAEQVFNNQPLVAFTLRWQNGYNMQPLTLLQHDVTLQVHHAPDEDETWVWRIIPTP